MNLDAGFDVSPGKMAALKARLLRLGIDPAAIEERFIKGGGPGGSKINATASCVQLSHPSLKLPIRCQRERRLSLNRFLALRELVDRVEEQVSPGISKRLKDGAKQRARKSRASRRARARHRAAGGGETI